MKEEYREFSTGENFIYSYIFTGIFFFAISFVFWSWEWLILRLWLVFGFVIFLVSEYQDYNKSFKPKQRGKK